MQDRDVCLIWFPSIYTENAQKGLCNSNCPNIVCVNDFNYSMSDVRGEKIICQHLLWIYLELRDL